jgi:hypothetical protein
MSAVPPLMPVTIPALFTVATFAFDDAHVATDVTVCVVLFDSVAVAVNCAVEPTLGWVPVTAMAVTVGVVFVGVVGGEVEPDVGPLPHAHAVIASAAAVIDARAIRRIECLPKWRMPITRPNESPPLPGTAASSNIKSGDNAPQPLQGERQHA